MLTPNVISLPAVLCSRPENKPVLTEDTPTKIHLGKDYLEICMHYRYERNEIGSSSDELEPEEAWKSCLPEYSAAKRVNVQHSCHIVIKKSSITFINFQFDSSIEKWYIEFDASSSPLIYVEHEEGKEAFRKITKWWKKKKWFLW
jgi:hypothetical protein